MNILKKIIPLFLVSWAITVSCSSSDDQATVETVNPPTAATLIYPENNTECNEGQIVSDTETDVLFKWQAATNASSYILVITDLNSGELREIKTTETEFFIRVLRATPYAWYIKSLVGGTTETAESQTWKFYNAGLPKLSHPPFPADAVSPLVGSSVQEGTINLQWLATDVDDDIANYKIFFDTVSPPLTEVGDSSINSFDVSANSGYIYYWQVVTIDAAGNTSDSQIFQFKVN
jgi:hypothetical protein